MKKFLFVLMGVFAVAGAFAAGENVPTSKSYVDSKLGEKQDIILANDGATQVLTNTGTAGEYGTKGIYNATGAYATQTQNLVDAATMNTAVQNAIDSEFQCIEWLDPNDHSSDCLLLDVFGQTEQSILPAGYTALEYIESTGTQYIDTETIPDTYYSMELDFQATKKQSEIFAGTRIENSTRSAFTINSGNSNTLFYVAFGSRGADGNRAVGDFDKNRHQIKISREGWVFDGAKRLYNFSNLTTNTSIYLFACNNQNTVQHASSIKIYNAKIWNNNLLVRNFIPARGDGDGEIGMYDTVTNTFFTNSGTGEFIAGPVVNLYLPSGN